MLGRRGVGRRHRQYMRDRPDAQLSSSNNLNHNQSNYQPPAHVSHLGTYVHKQKVKQASSSTTIAKQHHQPIVHDGNVPITFKYPDPHHRCHSVVLVASFDAYLHHKMQPTLPLAAVPRAFNITLKVPPGSHTYKFLVDGSWCTHPAIAKDHPIEQKTDGLKYHRIVIKQPSNPNIINNQNHMDTQLAPVAHPSDRERDRDRDRERSTHTHSHSHVQPVVTMCRLNDGDIRSTVFRSASASAVPPAHVRASIKNESTNPPPSFQKQTSSVSLHESSRRTHGDITPRGSSFTAPPPVGGISHTQAVNRKSLLQRVGSGWLKRFSSRGDDLKAVREDGTDRGISHIRTPRASQDKSTSGIFRHYTKERGSLFPSNNNNDSRRTSEDKENHYKGNRGQGCGTPERSGSRKGGNLRGSSRPQAVEISGPTKVDEPKDINEVNKQADNWRQMARHLQDDLFDPTAARELFTKAIDHREKHGLWGTSQNAQVHVDLARNLSKAEKMNQAEFHLRIALRIYNQTEAGKEHIADLMLYVGVVVDRQKRRVEAEELYRDALNMYKLHGIYSNNVDIAVKNLSLNLKKQNRENDVDQVQKLVGEIKTAAAIASTPKCAQPAVG